MIDVAVVVRPMRAEDIPAAVALQSLAFPPPFDPELLWKAEHLARHLDRFPEGQFAALDGGTLVGTGSNTRISARALKESTWDSVVGGPFLDTFDPTGDTLYGLDISVHPDFRRRGVGRALYDARFDLVRRLGLARYATTCRLPDFAESGEPSVARYAQSVVEGTRADRTLTPLLRIGLRFTGVKLGFMDDAESGHAAAQLEWTP
ncbi:MAG: GNAT family N-acetyltransferase [Fimbriimonadaceae bacterium]|nr:GNAT family N-acetyltransferase [Fimbriimonadaceae bacterium]